MTLNEYDEDGAKDDENEEDQKDEEEDECKKNKGDFFYRGLHARLNGDHRGQRKKESLLNFLPCLPSLVRARHLPCQTTSIMLKSYRSNGRLVIKEEVKKVQHREYFHAVLSNGRLTLYLVNQDAEAVPLSPN